MRIIELVESQNQIDEISAAGVGQGIGKAAGSVVQGAGNFFKGIKQGYKSARTPADTTGAAPAGTAPAAAPAVDVEQVKAQIAQKQQEIKSLQSQITKTEPGIGQAANTVSGTATNTPQPQAAAPTETPPTEPGIGQAANTVAATATNTQPAPAQWPAGLPKFNSVTGQKFTSPEEAEQVTNSPEFKQQMADVAAGKDTSQQPAPAPTGTTPPATPPEQQKLSAKDQNALKAKLKAKQGTAAKTQSGFNQYVQGGGGSTMAGADAQGNPVFKQNVQREGVEFYSKFLGQML